MVQYFDNGDLACFDGLSFRRDKKTGYYLNSKTHKRLHVYVWEFHNGAIPKGFHIHHSDMDKSNNEIENLVLLSKSEHEKLHGSMWSESRKEKARINLIENALPKAVEWHSSEEGRKWHSDHAKIVFENLPEKTYQCDYCGRYYNTKKTKSKGQNGFCSNRCKSAFRRMKGIDNVIKVCDRCGNEYEENKYKKTKLCQSCRHKKH